MTPSIQIIGSKICGGAERFYARLVNSLSETAPVLAVNPPNSPTAGLVKSGIKQIHPPFTNNYDLRSVLRIRKAAREMDSGIVQSYMGRATRLTRIPKDKGIVHVARLGGYYNLKAYRHAHHLVGNTKGLLDYFIKNGIPPERAHYIGNFVEPINPPPETERTRLRESLGIPDEAFVITCAARFHENKGLPDLLDAFSRVWNRLRQGTGSFSNDWKDIRLILVGDGPLADEIRRQIQTLGLQDGVILPGWTDPAPYYHLADLLVSPSRHEPLGNTILEAWACGKPLVATRTLGAEELITPDENGILTPLKNPQALADAFERLIDEPDRRAHLAANGARTAREKFSREIITGEYLALYNRLLRTS